MTTERENAIVVVNKIVMSVAWAACAAFLASMSASIHRIESRLEIVKEVQDKEHAVFKLQDAVHDVAIRNLTEELKSLQKHGNGPNNREDK